MRLSPFSSLLGLAVASLGAFACTTAHSDVSSDRTTMGAVAAAPRARQATAPVTATPAPGSHVYVRPTTEELRARLTPLQFEVTQHAATEPSFRNAYWDNHEAGLYVDIATGEPLFSSRDKFDSGTGWPSFSRPVEDGRVVEHSDDSLLMERTALTSKVGGSHLGHVFDDGPAPTGRRYCIDSASLRFIPAARLVAEGYGEYAAQFGVAAPPPVTPVAATSNSCTFPPPGETPGCHSTLETAIFARADGDDRSAKTNGVLDVARGFEGADPAVEVTFDPAKVTYAQLLDAWTAGRATGARVYTQDDAQKKAASAKTLSTVDAVPFRRE